MTLAAHWDLDASLFRIYDEMLMALVNKPVVSVLIPVYEPNLSYLKAALESVTIQDYPEIEVVVSEDSSSTIAIGQTLNKFLHSNLYHTISSNPPGIFQNLNHAIEQSTGEYIQILCQDDILYPGFISRQVEMFGQDEDVAMVFSSFHNIDSSGQRIAPKTRGNYNPSEMDLMDSVRAQQNFLKFGCLPGNLSPVMLKRTQLINAGMFDPSYLYAGDFEYWTRVSESGGKLLFYPEVGLAVRTHPARASKSFSGHTLINDLSRVYAKLIRDMESTSQNRWRGYINRGPGVQLFHDILRQGVSARVGIRQIQVAISSLNQFPFDIRQIIWSYVKCFPARFWRLLKN